MRRTTLVAAALLSTIALAGCSNSTSDEPAGDAKPSRKPASQTPTQDPGPLKIGQTHHWRDKGQNEERLSGTVTVLAYTQPSTQVDLPDEVADYDNPDWAVLEVKGCIDKDSGTSGFSQEPWALSFPDDTRVNAPLISGSGTAKPEYSVDGAVVKPGDCLRGKITFSVEHGTRPARILYGPADAAPAEWAVPKR